MSVIESRGELRVFGHRTVGVSKSDTKTRKTAAERSEVKTMTLTDAELERFRDFIDECRRGTHDWVSAAGLSSSVLLTRRQTAELLGLSEGTVSKWRNQAAHLVPEPVIAPNGRTYWLKGDVDEWIRRHGRNHGRPERRKK